MLWYDMHMQREHCALMFNFLGFQYSGFSNPVEWSHLHARQQEWRRRPLSPHGPFKRRECRMVQRQLLVLLLQGLRGMVTAASRRMRPLGPSLRQRPGQW